jgi:hypothetical protein
MWNCEYEEMWKLNVGMTPEKVVCNDEFFIEIKSLAVVFDFDRNTMHLLSMIFSFIHNDL